MYQMPFVLPFSIPLCLFSVSPPGSIPGFSAAVSLIVLLAALWVILSKRYPPKVEHWAYATVGTVLGFWLRG
jgi:hypothetical protein